KAVVPRKWLKRIQCVTFFCQRSRCWPRNTISKWPKSVVGVRAGLSMRIAGLATLRRGFGLHQIPIDMNRRRIAFVYAPGPGHGFHAPDVARLETMPFAM